MFRHAPHLALWSFTMKQWFKKINGLKGLYLISNLGNVFSLKTNKILRTANTKGYRYITIYTQDGQKTFSIHRLVAKAFLKNNDCSLVINHINEIKHDNRLVNLEWCTQKENVNHGTCIQRKIDLAPKMPCARYDMVTGEMLQSYKSTQDAMRDGYTRESVSRACRGIYANHKGFNWQFI